MTLVRKWDIDNKELTDRCIAEIVTRIEELEGERPGVIAANDIIDIVISYYGPEIHNKAVREVKKVLENRFDDTLIDVETMQIGNR